LLSLAILNMSMMIQKPIRKTKTPSPANNYEQTTTATTPPGPVRCAMGWARPGNKPRHFHGGATAHGTAEEATSKGPLPKQALPPSV
jgi:hypothetical protein